MKTFNRKYPYLYSLSDGCRNCVFPESEHVWRCAKCFEVLPVEDGLPVGHMHSTHATLYCPAESST